MTKTATLNFPFLQGTSPGGFLCRRMSHPFLIYLEGTDSIRSIVFILALMFSMVLGSSELCLWPSCPLLPPLPAHNPNRKSPWSFVLSKAHPVSSTVLNAFFKLIN